MSETEIIFEVSEDELDGGYSASALGFGIRTQGDTFDELRRNVREAVDCYFDDVMERPRLIRLHYVRDEVLVVSEHRTRERARKEVGEREARSTPVSTSRANPPIAGTDDPEPRLESFGSLRSVPKHALLLIV